MWTSCAALRLTRIRVQSTAWAAAKPITSHRPALGSLAVATSHAGKRRTLDQRRVRAAAGKNDAVDMAQCVPRFGRKWNQLGVRKPAKKAALWLPQRGANAIPRP